MVQCNRYERCERNTQSLKHDLRATQSEFKGVQIEAVPPPKAIADILVEGVRTNDFALVERLLLSRWNLNMAVDKNGSSFLHVAASSPNMTTQMCRLLINHGANPSFKDRAGLTCINRAENYGKSNQLREAMAEELALAAVEGNTEIVEVLLRAGLHADSTVENFETALHKAASVGNIWICQLLIKWHANLDAEDKNGKTPAAHAYANGQQSAARFLLRSGAKAPTGITAIPRRKKHQGESKSRLHMLVTGVRLRALGYARQHFMLKCNYHAVDQRDLEACEDMEHRMYREFITHQSSFCRVHESPEMDSCT
ncbi:hypothetical protein BSKO_08567 [Bryopsis sp. KO-2023]|nr:hypothetical protein BSKO_08567 [Bryopsis sp. KO-2023]